MNLPKDEPDVPYGVTTQTSGDPFPGYNLRGLIIAYLEHAGWTWDSVDERWRHSERDVSFGGAFATDYAVQSQIDFEEGHV